MSASIDNLFKAVQEACAPSLWSQGVMITRGDSSFVRGAQGAGETVVHIRLKNQRVSPKVTLWTDELDWDCDCGSAQSPCAHVVAAVIAVKRGSLTSAVSTSDAGPEASLAQLRYRFRRSPQGLSLERLIVSGAGTRKLESPLTSYMAGLQSGRVTGPSPIASKSDYAVDAALRSYRWGSPLDRAQLENLFRAFDNDLNIYLDDEKVQVSTEILTVRAELIDEGEGYRLRRVKNKSITESFPLGVALCTDTLKLIGRYNRQTQEAQWIEDGGSYWPPEQESKLVSEVLPTLRKKIPVDVASLKLPQMIDVLPRVDLLLEATKNFKGEDCLSVLANIVYGDPPLVQLHPSSLELVPVKGRLTSRMSQIVNRNQLAERQLMIKLSSELNLQPGRRVEYSGPNAVEWTQRFKGWEHRGDGFEKFYPNTRTLRPEFEITQGQNLRFDVQFIAQGDSAGEGARASFESVMRAWEQDSDYVPLLDGNWAKIPRDWMSKHGKKLADFLAARDARKEVPAYKVPELAQLCEETGQAYPEALASLKSLLDDYTGIPDSTLPSDLRAELRPYQKRGVNWLSFLRDSRLGALLADDMGLGKTLQTLCALRGKSLVVAPTSVLFNWEAELKKFRPSLKSSVYYGTTRSLDREADVVLTTYGVLRLDADRLRESEWDTIVIDEAQTIKNPESQIARAAHALRGKFRVALTGTPVENKLDDLWSQFHFINPGLLGTRESFLETFARPIGRGESDTAQRLRSRIKPFILRRLKRDVAPELPPRTETVLHCELDSTERSLYETVLASTKKEVVEALEQGGSILKALEVILRLRQACCHPALIPGQARDGATLSSSKVELLMESLDESLAEGHKSLVFSQWTSFLDLIARALEARGIRYSRIDGSTQNRQQLVSEFQSADGPPVMLISLKAGGVGLTLTAADHVYIMDPWWNPAVEDQAADRAHRIGQQNPVMIHRLVARETIEDRILSLQEKKKELARAVLEEGAAALNLTRQDLLDLLA